MQPSQTKTESARAVSIVLYGNLASKSNTRQLVWHRDRASGKRKPVYIKSKRALEFERAALAQLTGKHRLGLTGPLRLEATVFYDSRRPDLDVSLLMDVLESAGVYENDRQVHEQHLYKRLDRDNPRVLVEIMELDEV